MDNIRFARLKCGDDVIATVTQQDTSYTFKEPMVVLLKNSNLLMQNWLPVGIITKNEAQIGLDEVIAFMDPAPEFMEYYENTIRKMNEVLEAKANAAANSENLTDEEIQLMIDSMEELQSEGAVFH
jgi:hypothetical protein